MQSLKAPLTFVDYPLPPGEEKTEILRVVVRETMSLDLLDRLISDIIAVTEVIMKTDQVDLSVWQPSATQSVEKKHGSQGLPARKKHEAKRPMKHGVCLLFVSLERRQLTVCRSIARYAKNIRIIEERRKQCVQRNASI